MQPTIMAALNYSPLCDPYYTGGGGHVTAPAYADNIYFPLHRYEVMVTNYPIYDLITTL